MTLEVSYLLYLNISNKKLTFIRFLVSFCWIWNIFSLYATIIQRSSIWIMLRAHKNLSLLLMQWVILWQMNMPTFIEDYMGYQKLLNSTIMRAKGSLLSFSDVLQKKWFIATILPMRSIWLHKRWSKASFCKREMWCYSECEIIMLMSCLGWI